MLLWLWFFGLIDSFWHFPHINNLIDLVKLLVSSWRRLLACEPFWYKCKILLRSRYFYTFFEIHDLILLNFMLFRLKLNQDRLLTIRTNNGRVFNLVTLLRPLETHSIRPLRNNCFVVVIALFPCKGDLICCLIFFNIFPWQVKSSMFFLIGLLLPERKIIFFRAQYRRLLSFHALLYYRLRLLKYYALVFC